METAPTLGVELTLEPLTAFEGEAESWLHPALSHPPTFFQPLPLGGVEVPTGRGRGGRWQEGGLKAEAEDAVAWWGRVGGGRAGGRRDGSLWPGNEAGELRHGRSAEAADVRQHMHIRWRAKGRKVL